MYHIHGFLRLDVLKTRNPNVDVQSFVDFGKLLKRNRIGQNSSSKVTKCTVVIKIIMEKLSSE